MRMLPLTGWIRIFSTCGRQNAHSTRVRVVTFSFQKIVRRARNSPGISCVRWEAAGGEGLLPFRIEGDLETPLKVPFPATFTTNLENSWWTNYWVGSAENMEKESVAWRDAATSAVPLPRRLHGNGYLSLLQKHVPQAPSVQSQVSFFDMFFSVSLWF